MKKALALILICVMVIGTAYASDIDLSGMTYDELVALKEKINLAMWNCQEWQEVEVPAGVWKIGRDIPEGHWTITPVDDIYMNLCYFDKTNDSETDVGYGWDGINGYNKTLSTKKKKDGTWKDNDSPHSVDLVMKDGWYLKNNGTVIITPYSGKPDLGFK